ncbi:MAG: hypothetical protein HXY28_04025 [Hydrogenophilaceae bacterium]|jgi:hypothetical protein|nr:hypothetical protein [Hydrogenophilaceae bacterium]
MRAAGLWVSLAVVLIVMAASAAAIIVVFRFTDPQFVLGVFGIAVAIITASFQYRAAKDKETDARLFSEKQAVYSDLIGTLMGLFHEKKINPTPDEQTALVKKLQAIRTKLLVWGSAETIAMLDKMGELPAAEPEQAPAHMTRWMGALFAAIRKDLGHKDPPAASLEMALGMLIPADRGRLRQQLAKPA